MPLKLIALDIDGTLTSRAAEVSERNRAAIRAAQEAGVFVTLATGRGCLATRPLWRLLDIHGPSIQFGGALTVDTDTEHVLEEHALDPEVVRDVLNYSFEAGLHAQIYLGDFVLFERITPFAEKYVGRHALPYRIEPNLRGNRYEGVPKVLAYADAECEEEMLASYRERFCGVAQVSRSMPGFIEINALHVTKGSALESLARRLGIERSEVAAVGDNYLDYEMIDWAGLGVCVANGAESVRASADLTVPACDDDGVAYFIENYVLGHERSL